mmetsp:Transcript_17429/g.36324  ORF Transcript_17429/g.36324 Transcript_17429/m.36324 type:complete len:238 (+) Transcript_17429:1082-1795(+)
MPIQLRDNDTAHVHCSVKRQSLIENRLSLRSIHDKNSIVRPHRRRNLLHLFKQSLFLPVPPRRIHDDDFIPIIHKSIHPLLGNHHRIRLRVRSIKGNPQLGRILLQLIKRPGAKRIRADHAGLPPPPLIIMGIFGNGGGFPRALKAHEEDDVGFVSFHDVGFDDFAVVLVVCRGEHGGQFVDYRLLNEAIDVGVSGGRRVAVVAGHQVADLLLDVGSDRHNELDVDVRFDEGAGDVG